MTPNKQQLHSALLFLFTLLLHLPFVGHGYGREEDAWAQVLNAQKIWETGVYEVSRLPGHPLYELLLSALWPIHSPVLFNLLSTLATAGAVVFFYQITHRLKLNNPFLLSIAFLFVPVVFVAGQYTIDYNFALMLILGSLWALLHKKYLWAGVLLGMATGFRISSLAFVLPLSLMHWPLKPFNDWVKYWVATGLTALLCFLPPLFTYGISFLDFHKPPFTSWASIFYELSLGIWGVPLLIALAIIFVRFLLLRKSATLRNRHSTNDKLLLWSVLLIWFLQMLVFLRLPFKAEFFIPAVPFLFMLIGLYGREWDVKIVAIAALLSTFTLGFDYHNPYRGAPPSALALHFNAGGHALYLDPLQGPALLDAKKRNVKSQLVERVVTWQEKQQKPTWVIAGWYWPEIMLKAASNPLVDFDYYSTEDELKRARQAGKTIFYLPEINLANARINRHYLADSLGQPLL